MRGNPRHTQKFKHHLVNMPMITISFDNTQWTYEKRRFSLFLPYYLMFLLLAILWTRLKYGSALHALLLTRSYDTTATNLRPFHAYRYHRQMLSGGALMMGLTPSQLSGTGIYISLSTGYIWWPRYPCSLRKREVDSGFPPSLLFRCRHYHVDHFNLHRTKTS